MKFSIVIPAYNAEKYLKETVQSVVSQTVADWELMIVNDGSKDATLEVATACAKLDPRIKVFDKPNGGVSSTRNFGYIESDPTSEFVIFLDADDTWTPDALSCLHDALEMKPDAVIAYGLPTGMDSKGDPMRHGELEEEFRGRFCVQDGKLIDIPLEAPTTFSCEVYRNWIQTPGCALIRRSAIERTGLFDINLSGVEDWDMWMRMSLLGDIILVNRVVLRYRIHELGLSKQRPKMIHNEMKLRRKMLEWTKETPELYRLATWSLRLRALATAKDRLTWAKTDLKSGRAVGFLKQLRLSLLDYLSFKTGKIRFEK